MKELVVSEDIIPIAEFKRQASRLFKRVHDEGRPVLVTQNGRPVGVVVSPEEYDRFHEHERLLMAVQEGLRQSEAGHVLSGEDVARELDDAFGALPKKSA